MRLRQLALVIALVAPALLAQAQTASASPRQYYSSWNRHPTGGYHYRTLYYKPTVSYVGYKHHYCLYYTSRPKYVYFYNPYQKQYWGRCEVNHGGKYQLLAEADRRPTLQDIPESAFPVAADPPPLPETSDGVALDLPPDDLPLAG